MQPRPIFKFLLVCMILTGNLHLFSQDRVVKINGDTIECRILGVDDDKLEIKMKVKNRIVESYIPLEMVKSINYGLLEELKEEYDSSFIYTIEFTDGSEIYARITDRGSDDLLLESSALGEFRVKVIQINKIESERYSEDKKGAYRGAHPNRKR